MIEENQQPTTDQVRQAVDKVLASRGFVSSPRLVDFLRFVADETLAGRGDELKESLIGYHVYRKEASYSPSNDSTVRTEASRLRSRIRAYYQEEGANEALRISIPKGGYVLRWETPAPATTTAEDPVSPQAPVSPTPASGLPAWLIPAVVASLATAGLFWWTTIRTSSRESSKSATATPLTSFEGGEYEPAFSPDGERIAFTWNGGESVDYDIYYLDIARQRNGELPRRVTQRKGGEASPAWSPDAKQIAYLAIGPAPEAAVNIMELATGKERRVTSTKLHASLHDRHLAWSPDGRWLALADREAEGQPYCIDLVSVENGARRRLTSPPGQTLGDTGPAFSPDGTMVAFRRATSDAVKDIWIVPVAGGEARPVTQEGRHIPAHDWSRDGGSILFVGKRDGTIRALWRVSVARGSRPTGPMPYGQDAYFLAVARQGPPRVAFSLVVQDSDIWRVDLKQSEQPQKLFGSTRRDASPQYSPDGSRIVLRSERSGSDEIWVSEKGNLRRLTNFKGPLTGSPRWSPDGARIAFDSRPHGHSDIFSIASEGGQPVRLTTHASDDVLPYYSRDGRWIYFASNRSGTWQIWKMPAAVAEGQAAPVQVTAEGGFAPQQDAASDDLIYAKGPDNPALWRVPAAGGREQLILPQNVPGSWGLWTVRPEGIFHVLPNASVALFPFASRQGRTVATLKQKPMYYDSGFSLSPDGRYLLYAHMERDGSDIILVEE